VLLRTRDTNAALADLDATLRLDAGNVQAHVLRARLYNHQQLTDAALQDLNTAVTMQPGDAAGYQARAALLRQLGDVGAANDDLERARALQPGNLDLALLQVQVLKEQGKYEEALAIYRAILPAVAQPAAIYLDAGQMRYKLRQYRRALANYRLAAQLEPASGVAHYGVGLALRKLGSYSAAKQSFKEYLRLSPNAPERAELEAWSRKWGG
jgi:tetratricopeptide (TPR) repeat protein